MLSIIQKGSLTAMHTTEDYKSILNTIPPISNVKLFSGMTTAPTTANSSNISSFRIADILKSKDYEENPAATTVKYPKPTKLQPLAFNFGQLTPSPFLNPTLLNATPCKNYVGINQSSSKSSFNPCHPITNNPGFSNLHQEHVDGGGVYLGHVMKPIPSNNVSNTFQHVSPTTITSPSLWDSNIPNFTGHHTSTFIYPHSSMQTLDNPLSDSNPLTTSSSSHYALPCLKPEFFRYASFDGLSLFPKGKKISRFTTFLCRDTFHYVNYGSHICQ